MSGTDDFNFNTIGAAVPFLGYVSSVDKTVVYPGALVRGSQNVYKSLTGTIKNRFGLKLRGEEDATVAGVKTSYEWQTSLGATRVIRVVDGKMQVEFDDEGTIEYATLLTGLTDDEMRFSFTPWYSESLGKDELIFVNRTEVMFMWTGGLGKVAGSTATTITIDDTTNVQQLGFSESGTLIIDGVEYAYTGAGELANTVISNNDTDLDPAISETTWHSQLFTTSASATGILRASAAVKSGAISNSDSIFNAYIYSDNAGDPGTLLGTAQAQIDGQHSAGGPFILNFSFFELAASPLTNYHFVMKLVSSDATFEVYTGNTGGTGTQVSTDSGGTWSDENGPLYLTVEENTVNGDTFTGVTPNASGITVGAIAAQAVTENTQTSSGNDFQNVFGDFFTLDWVTTIGNQVYVGCYNSRLVFQSRQSNYLNFAIPAMRSPGAANYYSLDTNSRGASAKSGQEGNAVLFGSQGDSYSITNTVGTIQISATPSATGYAYVENQVISKQTSSDLSSPISQDFITSVGDTILFLDESNQLRQFGTLRNLNTPVYPILSLDVYSELDAVDFTGGAIRAVSDVTGETVYLTSPVTGALYMYQIRHRIDADGNLAAERIWQPPFIVNASRIAVIDGVTYVYSNANPQMYQLWNTGQWHDDSPSGDPLPYNSVMALAYRQLQNRAFQTRFDKVYYEGYMTQGSEVNAAVVLDYQGSTALYPTELNGPDNPATFYVGNIGASLGDASLGDNPLGDSVDESFIDEGNLPKFRVIQNVTPTDAFEFQLRVYSSEADSRWEILALGPNMEKSDENPVNIQKS